MIQNGYTAWVYDLFVILLIFVLLVVFISLIPFPCRINNVNIQKHLTIQVSKLISHLFTIKRINHVYGRPALILLILSLLKLIIFTLQIANTHWIHKNLKHMSFDQSIWWILVNSLYSHRYFLQSYLFSL